jgi:hypothetical protein
MLQQLLLLSELLLLGSSTGQDSWGCWQMLQLPQHLRQTTLLHQLLLLLLLHHCSSLHWRQRLQQQHWQQQKNEAGCRLQAPP